MMLVCTICGNSSNLTTEDFECVYCGGYVIEATDEDACGDDDDG